MLKEMDLEQTLLNHSKICTVFSRQNHSTLYQEITINSNLLGITPGQTSGPVGVATSWAVTNGNPVALETMYFQNATRVTLRMMAGQERCTDSGRSAGGTEWGGGRMEWDRTGSG